MKHLRNIGLLAMCLTLFSITARAQSEFSGIYVGTFSFEMTGIGEPQSESADISITIDNHGNLRFGEDVIEGPIIGMVSADGTLNVDASHIGWLVTEGTISNNTLVATNTIIAEPMVQNYRLEAVWTEALSVDNEAPYITSISSPTLNVETGLYEQDVLVYTGIDGLDYFEILVYNIFEESASLVDASYAIRVDPTDNESQILGYALIHAEPAPADTELTFTLEYEVEEGTELILVPVYTLGFEPGIQPTPQSGAVTIEKTTPEEALITFSVEPGTTYQLRWSADLIDWTEEPEFIAEETSWEWIIDFNAPKLFFQLGAVAP